MVLGIRLSYLLAPGVIALTVFAACAGSSTASRSDVNATADGTTPVVGEISSPAADDATVVASETSSPAGDDAAGEDDQARIVNCDNFVADVVPADLDEIVSRLPNQTLTDWVSYSDQFAIFTILDEEEQSNYQVRSIQGGIQRFGRSVTASIEETIWTAPGTEAIKGDITMIVSGWGSHYPNTARYPQGGPGRLEVGGRYMAPLVIYKYDAGNAWGIIELSTLILDDEAVVGPLEEPGITYMPVVGSRIGDTVDEVATALACTEREARSVKYSDLLPEARWQAVQADIRENTDLDDPERARLPD